MTRVYGIDIDLCDDICADDIAQMTEQEKIDLVLAHKDNGEVYTLDAWFNYLNNDGIDTENYYWVVLNY